MTYQVEKENIELKKRVAELEEIISNLTKELREALVIAKQ